MVLRSMISLEEVRCPYISSVSVCFMRLEYKGNALPMLLQCGLQPPLENIRQRYIYIYIFRVFLSCCLGGSPNTVTTIRSSAVPM